MRARALQILELWLDARTRTELAKFCLVGTSGYAVNLAVYSLLLHLASVHYVVAALCSFLVAATSNYALNRSWTFRDRRGHVFHQGMRFLLISEIALCANLLFLTLLAEVGLAKTPAQAVAIVLATPANFLGNKHWSFRDSRTEHAPSF
jgi:dolichol-phosphate mannosyltransferase